MRNIIISPIKAVLSEIPESSVYFILCSDVDLNIGNSSHILTLKFHDIESPQHLSAFQPAMAEQILDFFDHLPPNADLFVCCDYGVSRSAAIAAALQRYQGNDDLYIWQDPSYHPNAYVYWVCCRTFGFPVSTSELHELVALNQQALHDAIVKQT